MPLDDSVGAKRDAAAAASNFLCGPALNATIAFINKFVGNNIAASVRRHLSNADENRKTEQK